MRIVLFLSCLVYGLASSTVIASTSEYDRLFEQARQYETQQNYQAAMEIYERLITMDPVRPEAFNNLASLHVANNDLASAQTLLERAMKTNPTYATIYENLSKLYVEMARDSYGKALRLETGKTAFQLTRLEPAAELMAEASSEQQAPALIDAEASTSQPPPQQIDPPVRQQTVEIALVDEPAKAAQQEPGLEAQEKADIITTLQGWAAAWSEQAAEVYLVFYDESYHPPGMSRQTWEDQRRIKLKRPEWIRVGLKNMEIKPLNNKEARVELIQEYQASNYQDTTRKEFHLRQTHDGWRIIAERSLARIN